jgi:hypothetical protein
MEWNLDHIVSPALHLQGQWTGQGSAVAGKGLIPGPPDYSLDRDIRGGKGGMLVLGFTSFPSKGSGKTKVGRPKALSLRHFFSRRDASGVRMA